MPFDSTEKRLEIVLRSKQHNLGKNINDCWERVVKAGNAHIISKISNRYVCTYLLSESSLFVWNDRILMITCGNTTPVSALPEILNIINKQNIAYLFYERERSNFSKKLSCRFADDVASIRNFFDGKTLRFGNEEHSHINSFYSFCDCAVLKKLPSLQLMMYDLDPLAVKIFSKKREGDTGAQTTQLSKIDQIYPGAIIDSHLFSPYGYSINGIIDNNYFTAHVTPQLEGSYASFGTSILNKDLMSAIKKIISVFKPKKFSLLLKTDFSNTHLKLHSVIINAAQNMNIITKMFNSDFQCAATFFYAKNV